MSPELGTNRKLERLDGLIDWSRLEGLAARVREGRRGRPPYAPLSMLKALYPQALYDLSDPGLGEALLDRLSRRRFCGFALDGGTPDETTICRFRADAGAVLEAAFEEINRQLDAAGLILRKGTLMDEEEGPRLLRLQDASRCRPGLGADPAPGAEFGQDLRERGGRSADLRRRGGSLRRPRLRGQAATGKAQGRRHQGPDHAPAQQAHGLAATLAAAPQRSHCEAPGAGGSGLLGAVAPLRAEAVQELRAREEHRPPLRCRHRLQPAPRQPARGLLTAEHTRKPPLQTRDRQTAAAEPPPSTPPSTKTFPKIPDTRVLQRNPERAEGERKRHARMPALGSRQPIQGRRCRLRPAWRSLRGRPKRWWAPPSAAFLRRPGNP